MIFNVCLELFQVHNQMHSDDD